MIRKITPLVVVLIALLVPPVWAENPASDLTVAAPDAGAMELPELFPEPFLAGCFSNCYNEYAPTCGEGDQTCLDYVVEVCQCQCGFPRPSC